MGGFEKIDLQNNNRIAAKTKENESFSDMRKKKGHLIRNSSTVIIGIIVLIGLFIIFGVVLPAMNVAKQARLTYADAKQILDAAKKQNVQLASENLNKTKGDLLKTQNDLHALGYLSLIPILNWYYGDA